MVVDEKGKRKRRKKEGKGGNQLEVSEEEGIGSSEGELADSGGAMMKLDGKTLEKLQRLNPNLAKNLNIQNIVAQGGFINDDGLLCNADGTQVFDDTGQPLLVDSNILKDIATDNLQNVAMNENLSKLVQEAHGMGATPAQIAQMAQEQGATPEQLQSILSMGAPPAALAQLQGAMEGASAAEIATAARHMGASLAQVLQLAKEQGATPAQLAQISSQLQSQPSFSPGVSSSQLENLQQQMQGCSAAEIARAAQHMGANSAQVLNLAQSQGACTSELAQIEANINAHQMNSTQLSKLVASQGASAAELAQMQANIQSNGVPPNQLSQLQQQMSGTSATEIVRAAQQLGASPAQVIQLAKEQGASTSELAQLQQQVLTNNTNYVSSNQLSHIQKQMKGKSATEVARASLQMGASAAQAIQLAKEQGASGAELAQIQAQIQNSSKSGISPEQLSQLERKMSGTEAGDMAKTAQQMGASVAQVVQLAKEQGATPAELAQIQASAMSAQGGLGGLHQQMGGCSVEDIAKAAQLMGGTPDQVIQLAKQQGATSAQLAQIQASLLTSPVSNLTPTQQSELQQKLSGGSVADVAKAAQQMGASPSQVIQLAKAQGASATELATIKQTMQNNHLQGVSPGTLIQIQQQSIGKSASDVAKAAQQMGASPGQILEVAKASGASPEELAEIRRNVTLSSQEGGINLSHLAQEMGASQMKIAQLTTSSSNLNTVTQSNLTRGISANQIVELQQGMAGASVTELAVAAEKLGASPAQILQLAQSQGASARELALIQSHVTSSLNNKAQNNISVSSLAQLQNQMAGASAKDIALAAQHMGADVNQIVQLAQASGATPAETAQIVSQLNLQRSALNGGNCQGSSGVPPGQLAKLQQNLKNVSASQIAQAAQQLGASPSQIVQLAKEQGATAAEMAAIQSQLLMLSQVNNNQLQNQMGWGSTSDNINTSRSLGVSLTQMAQLKKDTKGVSIPEMTRFALQSGASPDQIIELAKFQGVSTEELNQLKKHLGNMCQNTPNRSTRLSQNSQLDGSKYKQLETSLRGKSSGELVSIAFESGASLEQMTELAQARGVSKRQLMSMQEEFQRKMSQKDDGASSQLANRKKSQSSQMSNGDVIGARVKNRNISSSHTLYDGGTDDSLVFTPKRSTYEAPDYSHLFEPVKSKGSDVDLDTIRYRTAKHVKAERKDTYAPLVTADGRNNDSFISSRNRSTVTVPVTGNMNALRGHSTRDDGILISKDGISRYRTVEDMKSLALDTDYAFDQALKQLEQQKATSKRFVSHEVVQDRRDQSSHEVSSASSSGTRLHKDRDQLDSYHKSYSPTERQIRRISRFTPAASFTSSFTTSSEQQSKPRTSTYEAPDYTRLLETSSIHGSEVGLESIRYRTADPVSSTLPKDQWRSSPSSVRSDGLCAKPPLNTAQEDLQHRINRASRSGEGSSSSKSDFHSPIPGLSEEEVKKLLVVFETEGILFSKNGVSRFRTVEDMKTVALDSDFAFDEALKQLEQKKAASKISSETQKLLDEILQKKFASIAALRERLQTKCNESDALNYASHRSRSQQDKRGDLYNADSYIDSVRKSISESRARHISEYSSSTRPNSRTVSPTPSYYSQLTAYDSILRPSVRRRFLLRKSEEESRRNSTESHSMDRKIKEMKFPQVPMMFYSSSSGFTRCYRVRSDSGSDQPSRTGSYLGMRSRLMSS